MAKLDSPDYGISLRQTFSPHLKNVSSYITAPVPTRPPLHGVPRRRRASEAGVFDHTEPRRYGVGVPPLRPHCAPLNPLLIPTKLGGYTRGSGTRCTTCAAGAGAGTRAGAGVPPLVGAASRGWRKLPQEFECSSALLLVLGALSVLLGCDMTNSCCCCAVAVYQYVCGGVFCACFFVSPRGATMPDFFF